MSSSMSTPDAFDYSTAISLWPSPKSSRKAKPPVFSVSSGSVPQNDLYLRVEIRVTMQVGKSGPE